MRSMLVAMMMLGAGVSRAAVPSASNSTIPRGIWVVGTQGGVPDEAGRFTVTVRDIANNPIPGALVTVALDDCARVHLCAGSCDPLVSACPARSLQRATDAAGVARFLVVGASEDDGVPPDGVPATGNPPPGCVRIVADGVELGHALCAVYDASGARYPATLGVEVVDIRTVNQAIGIGLQYYQRYDYDFNGKNDVRDLFFWNHLYAAGTSYSGCYDGNGKLGILCP